MDDAGFVENKLQSISWQRPGILEVVAYQKFSTRTKINKEFSLKSVLGATRGFRLIEAYYEFDGIYSKKVFRYQASLTLASPTNDDGPDAEKEQWTANVVMDQRDIALHPKIEEILKAGWGSIYCGKVFWPRMIYKDQTNESGNTETKPVKNPFYGTKSYFSPRIEITREKFLDGDGGIDGSVLDAIGWTDHTNTLPFMQNLVLTGSSTKRVQGSRVLKTEWQGGNGVFVKEIYEG